MQPIKMVDLYGQYLKIKEEVDHSVQEVIESSVFLKGGKVAVFEKELSDFLGCHVISCGNGTDALQLAFMALGLKQGDEVITTPFTFVSTVEVLVFLGIKPVFVDIDPATFNIDVNLIEDAISPKTKAILPVHLFGQCANMEPIMAIAKRHKLKVVEDAAQSLGCLYKFTDGSRQQSGTIGDIGCTSFFPTKNIGAFGDGGAVFCNDPDLADKVRSLANHGMEKKYHYKSVGINSRLDAIQAAILEVKFKKLGNYLSARKNAASHYNKQLQPIQEIKTPLQSTFSTHTYNQYTIQIEERDRLQAFLKEHGIPSQVYYPKPLHLQKAYTNLGYKEGSLPTSELVSQKVLSLPMHTELDIDQLGFISNSIKEYYS